MNDDNAARLGGDTVNDTKSIRDNIGAITKMRRVVFKLDGDPEPYHLDFRLPTVDEVRPLREKYFDLVTRYRSVERRLNSVEGPADGDPKDMATLMDMLERAQVDTVSLCANDPHGNDPLSDSVIHGMIIRSGGTNSPLVKVAGKLTGLRVQDNNTAQEDLDFNSPA